MPLANYTTNVSVEDTISEIERMLSTFGASSIAKDYEAGKPVGIEFTLKLDGHPLNFKLPINVSGASKALVSQKVKAMYRQPKRVEMIAWRILRDWVRVQLSMVEMQQAAVAQVFMPYARIGNQQVFEQFRAERQKQLGSGK